MILPSPTHSNYASLVNDIERGRLKIPQFQREFVWSLQKSAALIDSIIKGYPIGAFIFWATRERLRSVRNIGGADLPDAKEGEIVSFVLDGQQRLTSLYAAVTGAAVIRESGTTDDFSKIYVNLSAGEDDQIVTFETAPPDFGAHVSVKDLLSADLTFLVSFPKEYHNLISEYKRRISSYDFSIIEVKDVDLSVATEIFTRINVGGKPLTVFEIMVAKTYDEKSGFNLVESFDELISDLEPLDYETISDTSMLQLVSILHTGECDKRSILKIPRDTFVLTWPQAVDALERAVEFFRNTYRIPVSQLLPYNTLLLPFAYFFYHHRDKPDARQAALLLDFFWRCALGARYSSSLESRLAQDIKKVDHFLRSEAVTYEWPVDVTVDFLSDNGWFSANRAFVKAILCLFAYQQPKSFGDGGIVNIRNYWLKQANSKNYHHFFPKSFLANSQEYFYINHVVNITIVDDYLNKREIGSKAPSKYMKKFSKTNKVISETMRSHLIGDFDEFGIAGDDYDRFFEKRAEWIVAELNERLIRQDVDELGQVDLEDDEESEAVAAE